MNPREAEIFILGVETSLYIQESVLGVPTQPWVYQKQKIKVQKKMKQLFLLLVYATLQKNFEFSLSHLHKLDLIYVLLYTLRMARQCREQNQLPHLQTKKNAKTTKI